MKKFNGIVDYLSTKFEHIEKILFCLKENPELKVKTISEETGLSTGVIINTTPIMEELKFIVRRGRRNERISLLPDGFQISILLESKNTKKIKEKAIEIIPRSKILNEAYILLRENPKYPNNELGVQLRKNIGVTKTLSDGSYTTIGRTAKYILDGLQLVPYEAGTIKRTKRKHRDRLKDKLIPSASIDVINDILDNNFQDNDEWKVTKDNLSINQNKQLLYYVNSLIDLDIVEYIDHDNDVVKLTPKGINLRYCKNGIDRSKIFQNILLDYRPIYDILRFLSKNKEEFTLRDIGEIIQSYNKRNWTEDTKETYGRRLIGWFIEGEILKQDFNSGKYKFSNNFIQQNKQLNNNYKKIYEFENINNKQNKQKPPKNKIFDIKNINKFLNNLYWLRFKDNSNWFNDDELKQELLDINNSLKKSANTITIKRLEISKLLLEKGYDLHDKSLLENHFKMTYLELNEIEQV